MTSIRPISFAQTSPAPQGGYTRFGQTQRQKDNTPLHRPPSPFNDKLQRDAYIKQNMQFRTVPPSYYQYF